jgi:hypothetical protein
LIKWGFLVVLCACHDLFYDCFDESAADLEFDICTDLLDRLERGEIFDPDLHSLLLWLKAYRMLLNIEDNYRRI